LQFHKRTLPRDRSGLSPTIVQASMAESEAGNKFMAPATTASPCVMPSGGWGMWDAARPGPLTVPMSPNSHP